MLPFLPETGTAHSPCRSKFHASRGKSGEQVVFPSALALCFLVSEGIWDESLLTPYCRTNVGKLWRINSYSLQPCVRHEESLKAGGSAASFCRLSCCTHPMGL